MDCLIASGNWLIDTLNLQCGTPTEWKILYWVIVMSIAFLIAKRKAFSWKEGVTVIAIGLLIWFTLKIVIALLFVKAGLYTSGDFWINIRYIFLNNPF